VAAVLALETAVAPLDLVRRGGLRLATRSSTLTHVLARRDTRIAALGSAQVLALLVLTARWPVVMYFVGPVVFGVAHIAAGVRYLVLRQALPRALVVGSAVFGALLTLVHLCVGLHVASPALGARSDMALGALWVGIAVDLRLRSGWARLVAAGSTLAVAGAMIAHAEVVDLLMVHAHDALAFALWLLLFRRRPGWACSPAVVALLGVAFLVSGSSLSWSVEHGGLFAFGVRASRLASGLAPGVPPAFATALALSFVFLQSVHYAVWTSFIPQDCLRGEGTPTFRMTVRGLVADFGPVSLLVVLVVAAGFAVAACLDVRQSVSWYMTLSRAHVWLEVAVFAHLVGRR
jgi:hypothetical protein